MRAYDAMYGRALAYQELIDLIDNSAQRISDIRKQLEVAKVYDKIQTPSPKL